MNQTTDIRPSPLAGRWYPAHPKKLAESVDGYIQAAQIPEIKGEILALISPHAGHLYSGPVAGYAFKSIAKLHPELVVILSPFHQYHPGAILTSGHQAYQTPLGEVPVDQGSIEFVNQLLQEKSGVEVIEVQNDTEHAVEIILPFLQRALQNEFAILPLMLRQQDPGLMRIHWVRSWQNLCYPGKYYWSPAQIYPIFNRPEKPTNWTRPSSRAFSLWIQRTFIKPRRKTKALLVD